MSLTLEQLAGSLELEFRGDAALEIRAVNSPGSAQAGDLCYVLGQKQVADIRDSACSAVILTAQIADDFSDDVAGKSLIISTDPQHHFVEAMHALGLDYRPPQGVIHPSAQISATAILAESVGVCANAVIEDDVVIGAGSVIGSGSVVETGAMIGRDCYLHSNVTIAHSVRLGDRCIVQSGAVIGGDGFGLTMYQDEWRRIPQLGSVVIEDDVEIGANTAIDRGALDDTVIERGVKIDNLVHIAHNCRIGAHTAIAGCVGIAGSATIGRYCKISGASNINGHISIADNTTINATAMVTNNIREPGVYSSGIPAMDNAQWLRVSARYKSLDKLARTVARLEKRIDEDSADN